MKRSSRVKSLTVTLALFGVLLAGMFSSSAAASGLIYHGGDIQNSPHVYVTFWGKNWNQHSGARSAIQQMLSGISGSGWQGILTQYYDYSGYVSPQVSVDTWTDESINAPSGVNDKQIENEIEYATSQRGWPGSGVDNMYVVLPAPGSTYQSGFVEGCGAHRFSGALGSPYLHAGWPGEGSYQYCTALDPGQERPWVALSAIVSHEYAETVTNPVTIKYAGKPTGWISANGIDEIGNLCLQKVGQLPNGGYVQELWSNRTGACKMSEPITMAPGLEIAQVSCPRNAVKVSGSANLNGQVTVDFWKWEGGQWMLRHSPQFTASGGSYQGQATLGVGKWRARATLLSTGAVSGYQEFTILAEPDLEDASPGPRAIVDCNGMLHVFYRTAEGKLGHRWLAKGSETWGSETQSASIAANSVPRAVAHEKGINVFYRTTTGKLGDHWITYGAEWWGQASVGSSVAGEPSVLIDKNGMMHVFYRDTGGDLVHRWLAKGSETWGHEVQQTNIAANSIPRAVAHDNGINVFYRDTEGKLGDHWITYGAEWWGQAHEASSVTGDPNLLHDKNGVMHVFYRDTEGDLVHRWLAKGSETWSHEVQQTNIAANSTPRAVSHDNGVNVFYRDTNGKLGNHWITYGAEWWGQAHEGSSVAGEPNVLVDRNGVMHVFYRDTEGDLVHRWLAKGSETWGHEVQQTNIAPNSVPRAVAHHNGINVFYRDTEGKLGNHWITYGAEWWGQAHEAASIAGRAPLATTGAASEVTASGAKVAATVNPEGTPTDYYFEYGPTTSYGSKAPLASQGAGSGTSSVAVSTTLSGLAHSTTYHYRVAATSSEGTVKGADKTFTTLVGPLASFSFAFGKEGSANGQLNYPSGIEIDSQGDVWVADTYNSRVQQFSASGQYLSQFGTEGSANGQLVYPVGIEIDSEGDIWVADSENHRVQQFSASGQYLSKFGSFGTGNGQLFVPKDIEIDSEGDVWVADTHHNRVQQFSASGQYLSKFGSFGTGNGQLYYPGALEIDSEGDLWVADTYNSRVQQFSASGQYLSQFGSFGTGNGQLDHPGALEIDSEGNVWVADTYNSRVQRFGANGGYLGQFGKEGSGEGQFFETKGIAVDSAGGIWVADGGNSRVQKWLIE